MAAAFPYTQYACPCSELSNAPSFLNRRKSAYQPVADDLEDGTFNPHDPRANFSLFPLDHLLYCDECDAIRCPRCWLEEVITWYCPSCLFEVPSSVVKSDGNRCGRNCYNCPSCTAILQVTAVTNSGDQSGHLKPPSQSADESYILQCLYCEWTSLDVGIQLSKATKITEQLNKLRQSKSVKLRDSHANGLDKDATEKIPLDHEGLFSSLSAFYKEQLSETSDPQNPYSNSPYSSPANLARIMSLYGGLSYDALKKSREKPQPMREAGNQAEGRLAYTIDGEDEDEEVIRKMEELGWEGTVSTQQRHAAPVNFSARIADNLWPTATALRTRRGKRCTECRQILIRPDPKVNSTRYRIRLLALNHIPRLFLKPLNPGIPWKNPSFHLRSEPAETTLRSHVPQQYILTVRNPIFESIKVTLGTPTTTPGKVASRVTILCPSFTVGPAGDVWEEALGASTSVQNDGSRKAAMASLTGSTDSDRQPEAGKIWEKTRNSTSVVLEVVPGSLEPPLSVVPKSDEQMAEDALGEDDDVLEIPIYVRVEWEAHADTAKAAAAETAKEGAAKIPKELGYWCVLGIGRIG